MTDQPLKITKDANGVLHVWLNDPDRRNALSEAMIDALTGLAAREGQDKSTRLIVLGGEGAVFCAGGDLDWMRQQMEADRATRIAAARKLAMMLEALNTMPVPLIGRIHGGAYGGGVGLASICDIVIAAEGTRFGLTETRLGLIPATIGPYVAARLGAGRARSIFYSAKLFGAEEAAAMGLVTRVVPEIDLEDAIAAEIAPILNTAPGAVAAAKAHLRQLGPQIDHAMIEDSITRLADIWENPEANAGIAAFFARKPPPWSG